jgi:hypothetical protein
MAKSEGLGRRPPDELRCPSGAWMQEEVRKPSGPTESRHRVPLGQQVPSRSHSLRGPSYLSAELLESKVCPSMRGALRPAIVAARPQKIGILNSEQNTEFPEGTRLLLGIYLFQKKSASFTFPLTGFLGS